MTREEWLESISADTGMTSMSVFEDILRAAVAEAPPA